MTESERTCHVSVTLPKDLFERVARELPGLNRSEVFRDALRARLSCEHADFTCSACGKNVAHRDLVLEAVERFFLDSWAVVGEAVRVGEGAEFVARRLRDVAVAHGFDAALNQPLPRPTHGRQPRSERSH
jgi:hypothetical protein